MNSFSGTGRGCLALPSWPTAVVMLLAQIVILTGAAFASQFPAVAYEATDENFANPERGFYIQRGGYEPDRLGPDGALRLEDLREARKNHMSMVRLLYPLKNYREAPIPDDLLAKLTSDFGRAREAGVKVILRFSYSSAIGQPDASLERILSHIEQLTPAMRANSDVIAFLEAGFAGAWGEWHASTHGLFDAGPGIRWPQANARTRAILDKLLDALPRDRMVALRYPRHKWFFFGEEPLSRRDAFNGSPKARTAAINDCFLATAEDMGTYTDRMAEEKAFYHLDNLFVPQGGETCNADARAQPYIGCANALKELEYLRYSTLNINYNRQVLAVWEQGGCMPEIRRRMGYRYRLVESRIPGAAKPGSALRISFRVANDGWANLYNPRPVQLVLRHQATGRMHRFKLDEDPRFWMPGQIRRVEAQITIPPMAALGAYDVLLHLPDASPALMDRPEYAVRFANKDLWEPATGMNALRQTVNLDPNSEGAGR